MGKEPIKSESRNMIVERVRALRGPNLWNRTTCLEAQVFCEADERSYPNQSELEIAIRSYFPNVGPWRSTGNLENLSLAHFVGRVCLKLQTEAGSPVTFMHIAASLKDGYYRIVVQYDEEDLAKKAFDTAVELVNAAREGKPYDLTPALAAMRELYDDIKLGPSTNSIVQAAVRRGIPYRRLTQGSLVQFGWGVKQRRIQAAEIDTTSAISEAIAQDKDLTKNLLHAAGIPVPEGRLCETFEEAVDTFKALGGAVAVKPSDGNQGKGVTVNVLDEDHLRVAFDAAKQYGNGIPIVERFIPGHDYRFLVVGNQLVAAARREPPNVVGDGVHTVRELVEIENRDPRRGEGHGSALTKMKIDSIAVARIQKQGLEPDSVPAKGVRVVLRNNANLSTGGTATDVTDSVHPLMAAKVIQAAQQIGIDICGVDVVCERVDIPMHEQGGGIVEVNAAPGLRMHLEPSYGRGRDVGQAVIQTMYGPDNNGRIPLVAITGTNGKTTTVRLVSHILRHQGLTVGYTGTEGVYVGDHQLDTGDCSGPKSATKVLMHPDCEAAVLECARGGMLREGIGFDLCDVAIVTNIGEGDHLGLNFIDSVEDLALLKSVIIQNVNPKGLAVLNADDTHCVEMARRSPGPVMFFSTQTDSKIIAVHRAQGRPTCSLVGEPGNQQIRLSMDGVDHLFALKDIPVTENGLFDFQVGNVMCAIAACVKLQVPTEVIVDALKHFDSDTQSVPGRFNRFNHKGGMVIADYGHNPDAIAALVKTLSKVPAKTRRIVLSAAGDRRDVDITEQGRIAGGFFEDIILFEDACQRGREDGETFTLLQAGIAQSDQRPAGQKVVTLRGEFNAIQTALDAAAAGDVTLVLVDQVNEALEYLAKHCQS